MIIKDRGDAWMTRELIELIHDKENARKRAKKFTDNWDFDGEEVKYKISDIQTSKDEIV